MPGMMLDWGRHHDDDDVQPQETQPRLVSLILIHAVTTVTAIDFIQYPAVEKPRKQNNCTGVDPDASKRGHNDIVVL